jgi:hypothetical protein
VEGGAPRVHLVEALTDRINSIARGAKRPDP